MHGEIREAFNCIPRLLEGMQRRSRMDAANTQNKRSTLTLELPRPLLRRLNPVQAVSNLTIEISTLDGSIEAVIIFFATCNRCDIYAPKKLFS